MDEKKVISVFSVIKTNQVRFPFSIPSFLSLILFLAMCERSGQRVCMSVYIFFYHNYHIKNDKNGLYLGA